MPVHLDCTVLLSTRETTKGDLHVLKVLKRCREVNIFDDEAHVQCIFYAEKTIPMLFFRIQVDSPHRNLAIIFN
jgi:hypothetical protein